MMKTRLLALAIAALMLCGSLVGCDVGGGIVGDLLADYEGELDFGALLDMFGKEQTFEQPADPWEETLGGDYIYNEVPTPDTDLWEEQTWYDETWIEETWVEETWPVETWPVETEPQVTEPADTTEIVEETKPDIDAVISLQDVLVLDGDLGDWLTNNWIPIWQKEFDASNLDPWVGDPEPGEGFTMYTTCDSEYVYMAFEVHDPTPTYSDDGTYSGDAFQIQLDLGGLCAQSGEFERGIFYSFGMQKDGTMDVSVQCIYQDLASDLSYVMASDDSPEWREGEVKGVTREKEDGSGWVAEFAISWETLIRDVISKVGYKNIADLGLTTDNIKAVMLVCYIDREGNDGITGAWGTSLGKGKLTTAEGWYPENGGIVLGFDPAEFGVEDLNLDYDYIYGDK